MMQSGHIQKLLPERSSWRVLCSRAKASASGVFDAVVAVIVVVCGVLLLGSCLPQTLLQVSLQVPHRVLVGSFRSPHRVHLQC